MGVSLLFCDEGVLCCSSAIGGALMLNATFYSRSGFTKPKLWSGGTICLASALLMVGLIAAAVYAFL